MDVGKSPPPKIVLYTPTKPSKAHYVPFHCDAEETLLAGSSDEDSDDTRARKKARRENFAQDYLTYGHLPIATAGMRGPFDKGWKNPWAKKGKRPTTGSFVDLTSERDQSQNVLSNTLGRGAARQDPSTHGETSTNHNEDSLRNTSKDIHVPANRVAVVISTTRVRGSTHQDQQKPGGEQTSIKAPRSRPADSIHNVANVPQLESMQIPIASKNVVVQSTAQAQCNELDAHRMKRRFKNKAEVDEIERRLSILQASLARADAIHDKNVPSSTAEMTYLFARRQTLLEATDVVKPALIESTSSAPAAIPIGSRNLDAASNRPLPITTRHDYQEYSKIIAPVHIPTSSSQSSNFNKTTADQAVQTSPWDTFNSHRSLRSKQSRSSSQPDRSLQYSGCSWDSFMPTRGSRKFRMKRIQKFRYSQGSRPRPLREQGSSQQNVLSHAAPNATEKYSDRDSQVLQLSTCQNSNGALDITRASSSRLLYYAVVDKATANVNRDTPDQQVASQLSKVMDGQPSASARRAIIISSGESSAQSIDDGQFEAGGAKNSSQESLQRITTKARSLLPHASIENSCNASHEQSNGIRDVNLLERSLELRSNEQAANSKAPTGSPVFNPFPQNGHKKDHLRRASQGKQRRRVSPSLTDVKVDTAGATKSSSGTPFFSLSVASIDITTSISQSPSASAASNHLSDAQPSIARNGDPSVLSPMAERNSDDEDKNNHDNDPTMPSSLRISSIPDAQNPGVALQLATSASQLQTESPLLNFSALSESGDLHLLHLSPESMPRKSELPNPDVLIAKSRDSTRQSLGQSMRTSFKGAQWIGSLDDGMPDSSALLAAVTPQGDSSELQDAQRQRGGGGGWEGTGEWGMSLGSVIVGGEGSLA